MMRPV